MTFTNYPEVSPSVAPDDSILPHAEAHARLAAPYRILFLDHTALLGGGEIALLHLVQNLDGERYKPIVLLGGEGPLAARLQEKEIETHILPLAGGVAHARKDALGAKTLLHLKDVALLVGYIGRLAKFLKANRIDLIHANSLKADVIGGVAARLTHTPIIWHVRDRIEEDYLPPAVVRVFRRLCRLLPNYVITNSNATLQSLHLPEQRHSAAIYSGVDLRARKRVVHDGVERPIGNGERRYEPDERPCIGMVGRISPWKGQDIFLRAAAQVREQFPTARFQIIGAALFDEKEYEREVRNLACALGLADCVDFTGFRNDVPQLIADLDILVHASTIGEPFGQVVVEGMAAGKPVVATNGGGVPEIVLDGETGFLVPMKDAAAMAEAICRLLEEPEDACRMGALGQRRAYEHFSIQNTARKVENVYETLLQPGKHKQETSRK